MKIAKVKEPGNGNNQNQPGGRKIKYGYSNPRTIGEKDDVGKACFKVFESQTELDEMMKKENIWCYYEFDNKIDNETKMRYESFFSGFLYYYDTELRNGLIDHTLLCHWGSKNGKDSVTVFIDPAPARQLAISDKEKAKIVSEAAKEQNDKLSDAIDKWSPPGVSSLQSDPPSPSGPPPPAP